MSDEIELKLGLPRKALPALRRHPIIQAAPKLGNAATLENTYYDTPELELKARKVALRTRRHGRNWLQTIKCAAPSTAGLSARPEWEHPFSGSFDFSVIDNAPVQKLLLRHQHELIAVFTTRFRRETRLYEPRTGVRILMMIDTGEVSCGEHSDPICELELELEQGKPVDLLLLASALAADLPLIPNDVSKAERGYRLHLGYTPKPMRAAPSDIRADQTPVEAFQSLASACVRQWQANAVGAVADTATGVDPEFIHQLRVSQRRLRSLIRLFAPTLPDSFVSDWNQRLRQNADSFGDARDLDVLDEEIVLPVVGTTADEDAALASLHGVIGHARDQARASAQRALDPAAQGLLLIEFITALHTLPTNNLIGAVDLRKFMRLQMNKLHKKIRKRYKLARDLVPTHLHELRIALKQLRYAMEFLTPLMPAKPATRYLKALAEAQNALGFINDMDVARNRLTQWAQGDAQLLSAVGFVCGWHGPRYAKLCRRSIRDLEPLMDGKLPWQRC